ncbi:hypothetical protein V8E36_003207 [Tilletia maclaganii]
MVCMFISEGRSGDGWESGRRTGAIASRSGLLIIMMLPFFARRQPAAVSQCPETASAVVVRSIGPGIVTSHHVLYLSTAVVGVPTAVGSWFAFREGENDEDDDPPLLRNSDDVQPAPPGEEGREKDVEEIPRQGVWEGLSAVRSSRREVRLGSRLQKESDQGRRCGKGGKKGQRSELGLAFFYKDHRGHELFPSLSQSMVGKAGNVD